MPARQTLCKTLRKSVAELGQTPKSTNFGPARQCSAASNQIPPNLLRTTTRIPTLWKFEGGSLLVSEEISWDPAAQALLNHFYTCDNCHVSETVGS